MQCQLALDALHVRLQHEDGSVFEAHGLLEDRALGQGQPAHGGAQLGPGLVFGNGGMHAGAGSQAVALVAGTLFQTALDQGQFGAADAEDAEDAAVDAAGPQLMAEDLLGRSRPALGLDGGEECVEDRLHGKPLAPAAGKLAVPRLHGAWLCYAGERLGKIVPVGFGRIDADNLGLARALLRRLQEAPAGEADNLLEGVLEKAPVRHVPASGKALVDQAPLAGRLQLQLLREHEVGAGISLQHGAALAREPGPVQPLYQLGAEAGGPALEINGTAVAEEHEVDVGRLLETGIGLHGLLGHRRDGVPADKACEVARTAQLFHLLEGFGQLLPGQGLHHEDGRFVDIVAKDQCHHRVAPGAQAALLVFSWGHAPQGPAKVSSNRPSFKAASCRNLARSHEGRPVTGTKTFINSGMLSHE